MKQMLVALSSILGPQSGIYLQLVLTIFGLLIGLEEMVLVN